MLHVKDPKTFACGKVTSELSSHCFFRL